MRRAGAALLCVMTLAGCGYNEMVAMRERIEAAWAQVENQLQRRNDLIPNLIEVTKGYAAHERDIFERVANARARLIAGGSRDDKIGAASELSGALGRLLAVAERYPDLKANQQFARLSDELAGTENRVAVERMRYNDAVRTYNEYIKSFPHMLYAESLGFKPEKYFEAPEEAHKVPKVDFGSRPGEPAAQP
ncbi:MAG: LemA family protein [Deltaproteobacteria bacterium]|nr:MAG: LemA family protein [Deltaproteobacteria bacterium]